MNRLPERTGYEVLRALERGGFVQERVRGSHHYMVYQSDPSRRATVPVHKGRTLPLGTLRNILDSAKLGVDELQRFL